MAKVAFFSFSGQSDISGVSTWLLRFSSFLHTTGYEVSCLLHYYGPVNLASPLNIALSKQGIKVVERERPRYMEDSVRSVLDFLKIEQPQVFIPQSLFEGFYAARIAGQAGLPWIMTLHSDEEDYWKPLENVQPTRCRGSVVAVSGYIAEKAVKQDEGIDLQTIPCGSPKGFLAAKWNTKSFRVVFCGRTMEHQKRISLVVDTMITACRLNQKVECVVIGAGVDLLSAREKVAAANLTDRIVFLGRLEPDAVKYELCNCQAILLMSDFEGLPVALLEGMACGVVPIARQIPSGIPELVRDEETGILVNDSPLQAAEAICCLADNPKKWSKLSQGALMLFQSDYSEEVCFAKWKFHIEERIRTAGSKKPIRIPRRWRLPKPISSKMHPDIRRPPMYLRVYWKIRIRLGAMRSKLMTTLKPPLIFK